jgi:hypothetical protein
VRLTRRELVAGLKRLAGLVAVVAGGTVVVSGGFGVLLGVSIGRAVTVGLYLIGCLCLVLGFFYGNRPPVRVDGDGTPGGLGGLVRQGPARWSSPEERRDEIATSAVFVTLGFALIVIGALLDGRHRAV